MPIPEETIQQILGSTDIIELIEGYFPLQKRGQDYWACCPFHSEKTPSFKVSPTRQGYYCFGCQSKGNAIGFVMEYESLDFPSAVRRLADRAGITIKEEGSALSTQATTLNFVGANITATGGGAEKTITVIAGAGGTFAANAVGVHTTKLVGVNTTTIAGTATSEGAVQVRGNIAITEGLLTLDSNLHTSVSVPTGKNAMLIGPTTVAVGATIDVAQGSTLVVV